MLLWTIGIAYIFLFLNLTESLPKPKYYMTKEKWSSLNRYYITEVFIAIIEKWGKCAAEIIWSEN